MGGRAPSLSKPRIATEKSGEAAFVKVQLELELLISVIHERGHLKVVMILKETWLVSPGRPED